MLSKKFVANHNSLARSSLVSNFANSTQLPNQNTKAKSPVWSVQRACIKQYCHRQATLILWTIAHAKRTAILRYNTKHVLIHIKFGRVHFASMRNPHGGFWVAGVGRDNHVAATAWYNFCSVWRPPQHREVPQTAEALQRCAPIMITSIEAHN